MKTFILKISLFFFLLFTSVCFLFSKRQNSYIQKYKNISSSYDIINLGTSHGGGIKYDNINGKGFQYAGNTLYYDLQNYKYLKDYLNPGAIVIIPISYFSFGLDENRTDYADPTAFVNTFYMYLHASSIHNYSHKKHLQVYLNKAKVNYKSIIKERFLKEIKSVKKDDTTSNELRLLNHAKTSVKTHKKMGTYRSAEQNIVYLTELIKDIKESGFKPVLITTPYYKVYNEEFGKAWLEKHYYNHLNEVLKVYDIPYLDYSKDSRFESKAELFHNSDHFGQAGAKYFSNILFNDLKHLGLLNNPQIIN